MHLIVPDQFAFDNRSSNETNNNSTSNLSSLSSNSNRQASAVLSPNPSIASRATRLRAGPSIEIPRNLDDEEDDLDSSSSNKENYRFAPEIIRSRVSRRGSFQLNPGQQRYVRPSNRNSNMLAVQAPPLGSITITNQLNIQNGRLLSSIDNQAPMLAINSFKELRGQTLLHLAARLGHDEIMRLLISETSQAGTLMNTKGQTPLLTAIEAGSISTAMILMDADPRSIIASDASGSSVFHYACEHCSDVVLHRAIVLSKRLNSTSDRITALRRITERNYADKTPFDIAVEKGQLKCIKQIVLSSWLEANIDMRELIDASSMKKAIDRDQLDILTFFISEPKRFAYIIHLLVEVNGRYFNLLEYAILLKKKDIVRLFVSVRIPVEQYHFRFEYKQFLRHLNQPYAQTSSSPFYQTPIQRMLITPECVPLVPLVLEQFVSDRGVDLSVIDDCLYARPTKSRCIFGRTRHFSADHWLQQHPLSKEHESLVFFNEPSYKRTVFLLALISKADSKAVYDHRLVRMCVDLKFNLFGNFLYFIILCCQSLYVALYTGIALGSPTPANQGTSYYDMVNYSCFDLCVKLANDPVRPAGNLPALRALRLILLIISGFALLKELFQVLTQREEYFRRFYINLIELHMYVSAIMYTLDVNECTRQTGIRCSAQWKAGGIGLLSVWTSLLLVVMNGIKFGKHGLLFITVYVTFLKFIAVYFMIWIGYILAFYMLLKDIMDQFHFFNFIPKLLVMFIGEYDLGGTFFPNNNKMRPGVEGGLILYSAYVFTMFIVMMNIMGGLAVADVKEYRLNAKREHLRARIGVVLGLQARVGGICESIGNLIRSLSESVHFAKIWERVNLIPTKYHLRRLQIRTYKINIPHRVNAGYFSPMTLGQRREPVIFQGRVLSSSSSSSLSSENFGIFEQVQTETGYYCHEDETRDNNLFKEDENMRLMRKTDDIRDAVEESGIRTYNEIRKTALCLQNELEDLKRKLLK